MRSCWASILFWSMLIFTSLTAPLASLTTFSIIGCSVLQGPHQGAQKSTITGTVCEASITSLANFVWSLSLMRSGGSPCGAAPVSNVSMRPRKGEFTGRPQCGLRPPVTQGGGKNETAPTDDLTLRSSPSAAPTPMHEARLGWGGATQVARSSVASTKTRDWSRAPPAPCPTPKGCRVVSFIVAPKGRVSRGGKRRDACDPCFETPRCARLFSMRLSLYPKTREQALIIRAERKSSALRYVSKRPCL